MPMDRFFDTMIDVDYWYHAIHLYTCPTLLYCSDISCIPLKNNYALQRL